MLEKIRSLSPLLCGILPIKYSTNDDVQQNLSTLKSKLGSNENETGRERLYNMFSTDEFGNLSPELNSSLQVGYLGLFIGALYGGFTESRIAYLDFLHNNQATAFKSHLDAKRKLQDKMTLSFARGAFRWGWRLGFFSTSYILITTSISVYRAKSSIIEYMAGGGLTGAMYKFTLGPRGIIVGGVLGTLLGTVAGGFSLAILKLSGLSMEEVRYWQYKFHEDRQQKFHEIIKKHKEKDDNELIREYRLKVADLQNTLDTVDVETKEK